RRRVGLEGGLQHDGWRRRESRRSPEAHLRSTGPGERQGLGPRGTGRLGPLREDGPQRHRIRNDAGLRRRVFHLQAQDGIRAGPRADRRDLALRLGGAFMVAGPDRQRVAARSGDEGHRRLRGRFRRRPLDRRRSHRSRRARADHHGLADRAPAFARRGFVLRQAAVGDAQRIRWPRDEEGMIRASALPAQTVRWHEFPDDTSLLANALARVLAAARDAIAQHGAFDIVLAGGNTPRKLYRALRNADTDWTRWHVWFG